MKTASGMEYTIREPAFSRSGCGISSANLSLAAEPQMNTGEDAKQSYVPAKGYIPEVVSRI